VKNKENYQFFSSEGYLFKDGKKPYSVKAM